MPRLFHLGFWLAALACVPAGFSGDVRFQLADQKKTPIVDAAVSLHALDTPVGPANAPATVEIEQKGQEFIPFVTIVQTGTAVCLPNRDSVEHYVYSESAPKRFQRPLYAPGKAETEIFDKPGIVALGCNIHDWMIAYVVVVDTPLFGRSTPAGVASIPNVPPGRYRAEIWHPRLSRIDTREITVGPNGETVAATLTLKPDRRVRRAATTGAEGYR